MRRWANADALDAIIEEWTSLRTGKNRERTLLKAGVPASKYRTVADQLAPELATARGTSAVVESDSVSYRIVGSGFHLHAPLDDLPSSAVAAFWRAPRLGADTRAVRAERLGAARIEALIRSGVAKSDSAGDGT